MQTLAEIKSLLESRGLSPRHGFGQNFLIDHNLVRKLVDAAALSPNDIVLEVGPGTGVLTDELLSRGVTVVAAEIDRGLSALLRERLAAPLASNRFILVEGDCLDSKHALNPALLTTLRAVMSSANASRFRLVSNLPYAAGTPVMAILMADHPECDGLFVTIQREVAQRLTAQPSQREFGPLGLLAHLTCDIETIAKLPPECFWPRPDVTSAMIALRRHVAPPLANPRALFDFAQQLFAQRRKQLGAVLGRTRPFPPTIDPTTRAEALTLDQWVTLEQWHRASA